MRKFLFISILLLLIVAVSTRTISAQDTGNDVFDKNVVHELRLDYEQINFWQQMIDNYTSNPNGSNIPYVMAKVTFDGEVVDSIGTRFKGYTSFTFSDKKPIKLDFNEFVSGRKLDGLRKLNLNNATGDPAMQRDVIAYELMRKLGVAAPRTSFARLYINDEYWGLYQLVEQVDQEFLDDNFASANGNLYKNKDWAYWEWNGSSSTSYSPPFELKTNEDENDWTNLIQLHNVLNNIPDNQFKEAIEEVFNVPLYLKVLAVDVATENWDSNLEHGRNWYMYEEEETGRVNWIPWDYNFSMGGGAFPGGNSDECLIFPSFLAYQDGTTTVTFIDKSFIFGTEVEYFWDFGDDETSEEIQPVHEYDVHGTYEVCLTISQGVDCEEIFCSFVNTNYDPSTCPVIGSGNGPEEADEYFQEVILWIPSCCSTWDGDCQEWYEVLSNEGSGGSSFTIDQTDNERLLISKLLEVEEYREQYYSYFCQLLDEVMLEGELFDLMDFNFNLIDDGVAEDPNVEFTYEQFVEDIGATEITGLKAYLEQRIANLQEEITTLIDCSSTSLSLLAQEVTINELVASNDSTSMIMDNKEEFEDWIELYNNTDRIIDLSDLYLSNDPSNPLKWRIPVGSLINPEGYRTIWMDNDEEQNGYHAGFKLPKSGGTLILSNKDGSKIDEVTYGPQTTNVAYARIPNGTGDFIEKESTFGYNNENPVETEQEVQFTYQISPNPSADFIEIFIDSGEAYNADCSIIDLHGKVIFQEQMMGNYKLVEVGNYPSGFYIVRLSNASGQVQTKKLVVIK